MVPTDELPPATPLTCQLTVVFALLRTVAVNCCVDPSCTLAVAGETETLGPAGGLLPPPPQADRVAITSRAVAVRIALFIAGTSSKVEVLLATCFEAMMELSRPVPRSLTYDAKRRIRF